MRPEEYDEAGKDAKGNDVINNMVLLGWEQQLPAARDLMDGCTMPAIDLQGLPVNNVKARAVSLLAHSLAAGKGLTIEGIQQFSNEKRAAFVDYYMHTAIDSLLPKKSVNGQERY